MCEVGQLADGAHGAARHGGGEGREARLEEAQVRVERRLREAQRQLAVGLGRDPRGQHRVNDVLDIDIVPELVSLPEDFDHLVVHRFFYEVVDDAVLGMLHLVPDPVGIGYPESDRPDAMQLVVHLVIELAHDLVDAVEALGAQRMAFGHFFRAHDFAVLQPRARKDDLAPRVVNPAGFQKQQMPLAVDVQVEERVSLRVDVTHLCREVEDNILFSHQKIDGGDIPYVSDINGYPVFDLCYVGEITAIKRQHGIDNGYIGTQLDKLHRQVAADHAETAGYQNLFPRIAAVTVQAPLPAMTRCMWSARIPMFLS